MLRKPRADIGSGVVLKEDGLVISTWDFALKRWVPPQSREVCFGEGLSARIREQRKRRAEKGVTKWP